MTKRRFVTSVSLLLGLAITMLLSLYLYEAYLSLEASAGKHGGRTSLVYIPAVARFKSGDPKAFEELEERGPRRLGRAGCRRVLAQRGAAAEPRPGRSLPGLPLHYKGLPLHGAADRRSPGATRPRRLSLG